MKLAERITVVEVQLEERWKETIIRIKRIEAILIGTAGTIIVLLAGMLWKLLMAKKLQENSKYAMADADGDGIITDDEMDRHERWIRLENEDKLADTQRMMAWIAMVVTIVAVIVLLTPVVAIDRVATASGFLNTFIVAQLGVVVGFMGATALSKTKLKSIQVYDTMSRLVFETAMDASNHTLNVSDYSEGIYFLKLKTASGEHVERFIKN